jgi:hypothetical protein
MRSCISFIGGFMYQDNNGNQFYSYAQAVQYYGGDLYPDEDEPVVEETKTGAIPANFFFSL